MLGGMGALYEYPNMIIACTVLALGPKPRAVCVVMTLAFASGCDGSRGCRGGAAGGTGVKGDRSGAPAARAWRKMLPVEAGPRLPAIGAGPPG